MMEPDNLQTTLVYWDFVTEMVDSKQVQYFKQIEKSIDSGLNELIQTDLYRISSEGNALNFELTTL